MSDSLWAMEQQQATIVVITDLSTAFDTVNHDILLSVLNNRFGLQGKILNCIENLFTSKKLQSMYRSDVRQFK